MSNTTRQVDDNKPQGNKEESCEQLSCLTTMVLLIYTMLLTDNIVLSSSSLLYKLTLTLRQAELQRASRMLDLWSCGLF